MSALIGFHKYAPVKGLPTDLTVETIGSNGAGSLLIEHWLAGLTLSEHVDKSEARKLRKHFRYANDNERSKQLPVMVFDLSKREHLEIALKDGTDDQTWLRSWRDRQGVGGLRNVQHHRLKDKHLRLLVVLHQLCDSYHSYSVSISVTRTMWEAVDWGTRELERLESPWATKCRRCALVVQRAYEKHAYLSIG